MISYDAISYHIMSYDIMYAEGGSRLELFLGGRGVYEVGRYEACGVNVPSSGATIHSPSCLQKCIRPDEWHPPEGVHASSSAMHF